MVLDTFFTMPEQPPTQPKVERRAQSKSPSTEGPHLQGQDVLRYGVGYQGHHFTESGLAGKANHQSPSPL